jgi:hypothetical protein
MSQTVPKKTFHFGNFKVGLFISLAAQPFEVVRTTSITSLKNNKNSLAETISVAKKIFRMEGPRGFFRGGLLGLGKSTLGAGVFFNGIENMHVLTRQFREIKYLPNNVIDFCNAGFARIFTTLTVSPLNVLKTRFEVVGNNQYKSIPDAFRTVYKNQGLKGFYRGIIPTLIRDVPFAGLEYSTYRYFLSLYGRYIDPTRNPYDSSYVVFSCAGASAILAVLLTYPFDNMRVRLQTSDMGAKQIKGLMPMISHVYKEEGIRGFYLGYLPRLMKKGFACSLAWTFYESIRSSEKRVIN